MTETSTHLTRTPLNNAIPAEQVATWSDSWPFPRPQTQRTLSTGILGNVSRLRTNVTASVITSEQNEMQCDF